MNVEGVGQFEASDIDKIVDRLLRDLGNPEPPLSLDMVREVLKLDLKFYSSAEHSIIEEVSHRVRVGATQIWLRPGLIVDAIKKAKLSAIWMPDTKRILIDDSVPKLKHRWIEAHEIGHSITPWHREFLFGDTEYTLDPDCHAVVEAEANYAASQMLFLRGRFGAESRDVDLDFKTIKKMAKRYGNTITTSLWRTVQERNAGQPVFGMVSCHPRHPSIGSGSEGQKIRYFMSSQAFRERFGCVSADTIYGVLHSKAGWTQRGTVVDSSSVFTDNRGDDYEFRIESFCNTYALLTYGVLIGPRRTLMAVA